MSANNYEFWYLNNGITITCDTLSYPPRVRQPSVSLTNVQVVNGGQTTNALFEAYREDPDRVRDVLVLLRIYETRELDLSSRIAEATNSQTPIKSRDLRSNDLVQKQIEAMLDTSGYFWERKSGAYSDRPLEKRIDMVTAGQAILAYHEGLPEIAKKDKARVVGDLYEDIFDEDKLTLGRILTPILLLRLVDRAKKAAQRKVKNGAEISLGELILIDGSYHVLYAAGSIAERHGLSRDNFESVSPLLELAQISVAGAVKERMRTDKAFSLSRFFKDGNSKRDIEKTMKMI